jgi:hypothetical protein
MKNQNIIINNKARPCIFPPNAIKNNHNHLRRLANVWQGERKRERISESQPTASTQSFQATLRKECITSHIL